MYNNLGFFWSSISTMQMTIHLIANSHYVGIFINTIQLFSSLRSQSVINSPKFLQGFEKGRSTGKDTSFSFLPFFSIILHSCNFLESLESKLHLHHHFHNYIHQ